MLAIAGDAHIFVQVRNKPHFALAKNPKFGTLSAIKFRADAQEQCLKN
jgi:hypothetical protein